MQAACFGPNTDAMVRGSVSELRMVLLDCVGSDRRSPSATPLSGGYAIMAIVSKHRIAPMGSPFWTHVLAAIAAVLLLLGSCVSSAKRDSVSWDESQHLYSGWLSWERGDFGYNPEVPPLIKMWDALPLLHREIKMPAYTGGEFKKEGFVLGQRFLAGNGMDRTLIPARMMASLLTLLLAVTIYFCAKEMFGSNAALFALLLFCFDPNFLAQGAFVTTDVGASLTMLAAVFAFYRYVKRPSTGRMILVGVAVALAMTAKFTGVFLPLVLGMIALADLLWCRPSRGTEMASARQITLTLAVASLIGVAWIWVLYHLRYAARPAPLRLDPTSQVYLQRLGSPLVRWVMATVNRLHLLPEAYLYGLADTEISSSSLPSYLFGRTYAGAPHWYFPAALLIKSTLPFLMLLGVTVVVASGREWKARREIAFLGIPSLFLFVLSSSSAMGIGYRHLFPMLPLLYILVAGCAAYLIARKPKYAYAFGALLLWQVLTTEMARPGLMAYANEAWGGPSRTHLYLSDSNVDWGQQLKDVKRYTESHANEPCYFAYFAQGPVDFRDYGVRCHVLPTGSALWTGLPTMRFGANDPSVSGTLLISDGVVAGADIPGKNNPYARFAAVRPAAVIDHGVYVYQGRFDLHEAAAVEEVHAAEDAAAEQNNALAMREGRLAVALDPNNPEAHEVLGNALAASGNTAAARLEYAAALRSSELDPVFQRDLFVRLRSKTEP